MGDEEFTLREHDERDEADRLADPTPPGYEPLYKAADIELLSDIAGILSVLVVNRPLPDEAVPKCRVSVAGRTATTDTKGNARIDISEIGNGEHVIEVIAPDTYDGPIGPGFPSDIEKLRIWRRFGGRLSIHDGQITKAEPNEWIKVRSGRKVSVLLQPAWIKARLGGQDNKPDLVVLHQTVGRLPDDLKTLITKKSVHYFVAANGEVYKLVHESKTAAHAGDSYWQGEERLNSRSIGIEISHVFMTEYPKEQVDAVVDLVTRLKDSFPKISADRFVGHSDIGFCYENSEDCASGPKRVGRKADDPSSAFPWEQIEALGVSFQIQQGTLLQDIYGGFFKLVADGKLVRGDSDGKHRYGGKVRQQVAGAVREVQKDLADLGYYCIVNSNYDEVTLQAVMMFQRHIFSGTRRTDKPNHHASGDGSFDAKTAEYLKRVLGQVNGSAVS